MLPERASVAPTVGGDVFLRLLHPEDLPAAACLASAAFRENRFYQDVMGFDAPSFDQYWRAFFPLALEDPAARVFALEVSGRLAGLLVASLDRFPSPFRGLTFLGKLSLGVGLPRLVRYLRFVARYEQVMRRPASERSLEARGLWLVVAPDAGKIGLGAILIRSAMSTLHCEGKTIFTGLLDASNRRLIDFYRRAGFQVGSPFRLGPGIAATFVHRRQEDASC